MKYVYSTITRFIDKNPSYYRDSIGELLNDIDSKMSTMVIKKENSSLTFIENDKLEVYNQLARLREFLVTLTDNVDSFEKNISETAVNVDYILTDANHTKDPRTRELMLQGIKETSYKNYIFPVMHPRSSMYLRHNIVLTSLEKNQYVTIFRETMREFKEVIDADTRKWLRHYFYMKSINLNNYIHVTETSK